MQLLEEEGVALGPVDDQDRPGPAVRVDHRGARATIASGLGARQRIEPDRGDARCASRPSRDDRVDSGRARRQDEERAVRPRRTDAARAGRGAAARPSGCPRRGGPIGRSATTSSSSVDPGVVQPGLRGHRVEVAGRVETRWSGRGHRRSPSSSEHPLRAGLTPRIPSCPRQDLGERPVGDPLRRTRDSGPIRTIGGGVPPRTDPSQRRTRVDLPTPGSPTTVIVRGSASSTARRNAPSRAASSSPRPTKVRPRPAGRVSVDCVGLQARRSVLPCEGERPADRRQRPRSDNDLPGCGGASQCGGRVDRGTGDRRPVSGSAAGDRPRRPRCPPRPPARRRRTRRPDGDAARAALSARSAWSSWALGDPNAAMTVPSASPMTRPPLGRYLRRDVGEEATAGDRGGVQDLVDARRVAARAANRTVTSLSSDAAGGSGPSSRSPTRSGASRLGSWRRIACSRCWSSGLRLETQLVDQRRPQVLVARSASAWRPARYRASISCARGSLVERLGPAMSASMLGDRAPRGGPRASSASIPVAGRRQPRLLERRAIAAGAKGSRDEVGQRGAGATAPRPRGGPGRAGWVAGSSCAVARPGAGAERLEAGEVELAGLDAQEVAAGAGEQCAARAPRGSHARAEGRRRRPRARAPAVAGGVIAPERVDEPVEW